jgi:hypothetical protein
MGKKAAKKKRPADKKAAARKALGKAKRAVKKAATAAKAAVKPTIHRRLTDQEALVFEKLEAQHAAAHAKAEAADILIGSCRDRMAEFLRSLNIRDRKRKPVERFSVGRVDGVLCAVPPADEQA